MSKVNTVGAELAELRLVRAATDITGYGLMGHLVSLCRASGVSAEVDSSAVPMIDEEIAELIEQACIPGGSRENLVATTVAVDWGSTDDSRRILLTDAQTSGGLLLCVPETKLEKVLGILRQRRTPCAAVIRKNYCPSASWSIDMRERMKPRSRREIPAVNKILDALGEYDLATASKLPRPLVVDLVRRELSKIRSNREIPEFESTIEHLHRSLELLRASRLQQVINGTGIVIHTNLGRAPIAQTAIRALTEIGSGYSNLEYDLATGERGQRGAYIENALALLCGAEAATAVNNCAAALVLIVHHFAARNGRARPQPARRGRGAPSKNEIIISRGEIVQIGGGFRIGEIIEATGAIFREVGATNKTTLDDYRRAIDSRSAMILKVHRSNFFMSGFVESPPAASIAALARKSGFLLWRIWAAARLCRLSNLGLPSTNRHPRKH